MTALRKYLNRARILHAGARRALGADATETVRLSDNYRSLGTVVDFNNRVIGRAVAADNARLNAELARAADGGGLDAGLCRSLSDTLADAYRGHEQRAARHADRPGYVRVADYADEPPVVECICEVLDRGFRPRDILILVRTNAEGVRIAERLLDFKRRNSDPRYRFDVMTQEALVAGKAPVCAFLAAAMRLALDPGDRMHRAV